MKPLELEEITTNNTFCCGKNAPYDHPKVYLAIDPKTKQVECPYCSKRFIRIEKS